MVKPDFAKKKVGDFIDCAAEGEVVFFYLYDEKYFNPFKFTDTSIPGQLYRPENLVG
jgi:hypothetical protein